MPRPSRIRPWLTLPLVVVVVSVTCRDEGPTAPGAPHRDASPAVALPRAVSASVATTSSSQVLVGAGDIANCDRLANSEATAKLLDGIEGTVFTAGDNAYRDGSAALRRLLPADVGAPQGAHAPRPGGSRLPDGRRGGLLRLLRRRRR